MLCNPFTDTRSRGITEGYNNMSDSGVSREEEIGEEDQGSLLPIPALRKALRGVSYTRPAPQNRPLTKPHRTPPLRLHEIHSTANPPSPVPVLINGRDFIPRKILKVAVSRDTVCGAQGPPYAALPLDPQPSTGHPRTRCPASPYAS